MSYKNKFKQYIKEISTYIQAIMDGKTVEYNIDSWDKNYWSEVDNLSIFGGLGKYKRFRIIGEINNNEVKKYTIGEIIEIINSLPILIPIEDLFTDNSEHITKKQYGKILLKYLCKELKSEVNKQR